MRILTLNLPGKREGFLWLTCLLSGRLRIRILMICLWEGKTLKASSCFLNCQSRKFFHRGPALTPWGFLRRTDFSLGWACDKNQLLIVLTPIRKILKGLLMSYWEQNSSCRPSMPYLPFSRMPTALVFLLPSPPVALQTLLFHPNINMTHVYLDVERFLQSDLLPVRILCVSEISVWSPAKVNLSFLLWLSVSCWMAGKVQWIQWRNGCQGSLIWINV